MPVDASPWLGGELGVLRIDEDIVLEPGSDAWNDEQ
jgi:hypothetical protein